MQMEREDEKPRDYDKDFTEMVEAWMKKRIAIIDDPTKSEEVRARATWEMQTSHEKLAAIPMEMSGYDRCIRFMHIQYEAM